MTGIFYKLQKLRVLLVCYDTQLRLLRDDFTNDRVWKLFRN